jgi:hypothetical protein
MRFDFSGFPDYREVDLNVWSFTPRVRFSQPLHGLENALVVGYDDYRWDYRLNKSNSVTNIVQPVNRVTAVQRNRAFYMQDTLRLDERTTLVAGARRERFGVEGNDVYDAGAPGDDPYYGHGMLNLGWAMNRNDVTRVDTAVASHYYDAANREMDFIVQNRSALAVSGLTLAIDAAGTASTQAIPALAPGATYVVKIPVNPAALAASGSMKFVTQLVNPTSLTDAVPAV